MSRPDLRAAVWGSPIGHSRSPQLHRAAYEFLGLEVDYRRYEAQPQDIDAVLSALDAEPGRWLGFSVTMPLKAEFARRVARPSDRVQRLGALNTVVFDAEGRPDPAAAAGENTDVEGIIRALREADDLSAPHRMGLIGAGATAAAGLEAARQMGCAAVTVYARTASRAAPLQDLARTSGIELEVRDLTEVTTDLGHHRLDAVVSTLPPGAADGVAAQIHELVHELAAGLPLLDVAYDPWPSALALSWEEAGGQVVNGLTMLLHQAVEQVRLFTRSTERPAESLSEDEHTAMVDAMGAAIGLSSR